MVSFCFFQKKILKNIFRFQRLWDQLRKNENFEFAEKLPKIFRIKLIFSKYKYFDIIKRIIKKNLRKIGPKALLGAKVEIQDKNTPVGLFGEPSNNSPP